MTLSEAAKQAALTSEYGDAQELSRQLRDSYSEFETGFRRKHPVLWWSSLLGPLIVSVVVLLVVYVVAGAEYTRRLLTMVAAALWFFGRFVILGGHDPDVAQYAGGMSSGELFCMVLYLDVMVAFLLAFHVGYLFRLPIIGPRVGALVADARFILEAQRWMRRAAFVGVLLFVSFPLQATGSVGGSLFGRMLGMSRVATFFAIVIGSVIGNGVMYLGSDLINAYFDKNHPLVKYGGLVLIVLVIVLLNWWYQRKKRRYLQSGKLPAALSIDTVPRPDADPD
jgi:uncharacterized membrane protein